MITRGEANNGDDGNHADSRRHRHGGNEQDPREKHRPRHIHGPATASNRQRRPRRTQTETQPVFAPPHLSNERGAERYDNRAERIANRPARGNEKNPHEKPRKQARQGEAIAAREATNNRATTSDDDARRQQRPATHVERTGREARRERPSRGIQFVLIAHPGRGAEPSYQSSTPRRFHLLAAKSQGVGKTQRGQIVHAKYENPISE